jgi:hypothetical protein
MYDGYKSINNLLQDTSSYEYIICDTDWNKPDILRAKDKISGDYVEFVECKDGRWTKKELFDIIISNKEPSYKTLTF